MTRDEIVEKLASCARQSEDAAASCEAAAQHHRPEYERCVHISPPDATSKIHARALELYAHVINNEHEAHRLQEEAELFREIIVLLLEESE